MVRNTYALAYEVKEGAFSLEHEIVRPGVHRLQPSLTSDTLQGTAKLATLVV